MYIMVAGSIACGKTTLCQRLAALPRVYVKTQTAEIIGRTIDTPGEYMENRTLWNRLAVSAVDSALVLFLQDPVNRNFRFSPGQAAMFQVPVAGVITKIDLAGEDDIRYAEELLTLAGASPVFAVSSVSGEGMDRLSRYIHSLDHPACESAMPSKRKLH
ncbi:MAG: EutP/PduV family microcompartment system protein [Spirochaetaceae bacterium]|jgi:ethanolamine utilization protein EutP|nr:EutP/PduV family microcompartment system protein [Spirochaetaceae bacterium]